MKYSHGGKAKETDNRLSILILTFFFNKKSMKKSRIFLYNFPIKSSSEYLIIEVWTESSKKNRFNRYIHFD